MNERSVDWNAVDLVVFDVDGTLYNQRRLRMIMAGALLRHALDCRSLADARTLWHFRRCREKLAGEQLDEFLAAQYHRTAMRVRREPAEVQQLVSDWIETRPLTYLQSVRLRGVDRIFAALRGRGVPVAIFSDYPATAKLDALGLSADLVVCAGEREEARLKPDPAALHHILRQTGVSAARALMIGDRFDRDAAAAQAAGMPALIRSRKQDPRALTFRRYDDPLFQPLLQTAGVRGAA